MFVTCIFRGGDGAVGACAADPQPQGQAESVYVGRRTSLETAMELLGESIRVDANKLAGMDELTFWPGSSFNPEKRERERERVLRA